MDKEILKTIIKEGQEDIISVELYERPFGFEENGRYVMVGVRHAGKSYMLYQRARQLLSEGHNINEMLYVNFDDERLFGTVKAESLDEILQAYSAMYTTKPILFLDEIQNIDGWEHLPEDLPIRSIRSMLQAAMPKCSAGTSKQCWAIVISMLTYIHIHSRSIWERKESLWK